MRTLGCGEVSKREEPERRKEEWNAAPRRSPVSAGVVESCSGEVCNFHLLLSLVRPHGQSVLSTPAFVIT